MFVCVEGGVIKSAEVRGKGAGRAEFSFRQLP